MVSRACARTICADGAGMPRRSSILTLPGTVRDGLDKLIRANVTLDQIVEAIEAEFGLKLSRSSVHRYRQQAEAVAAKMKESKEIARVVVGQLGEDLHDRTGRMLVELLHTMVFRWMGAVTTGDVEEALGSKDFMHLARALRDTAHAATINEERERKIRREAQDALAKAVREEARQEGLSDDTIRAIVFKAIKKAG